MAQERRGVIGWLLGTGLFGSLGSFLYPALRFIDPPAIPEAAVNEVTAGKITDIQPNTGKIVKFGSHPVLLVRVSGDDLRAFSAVCTHLNCTVQFQRETGQIWCACHNGRYDLNGRVLSGPPPAPLEQYSVRVRGEEIVILRHS